MRAAADEAADVATVDVAADVAAVYVEAVSVTNVEAVSVTARLQGESGCTAPYVYVARKRVSHAV